MKTSNLRPRRTFLARREAWTVQYTPRKWLGILEYWSVGVLGRIRFPITPALHHSSPPRCLRDLRWLFSSPLGGTTHQYRTRVNAILFFVLLALIIPSLSLFAAEKGASGHEGHGKPSPKVEKREPGKIEQMDLKGLTMESIEKEGKIKEPAPGAVQISPERQQLIGVKFGKVEMRPLRKVIRTVGRVGYDERKVVVVSTKVGGWIEDLHVDFTGRLVVSGEPLLTIYSPELVATQEEYLLSLKAKKAFERSPFPEVAASGGSLAEAARRRLGLWDISEDQIRALEHGAKPQKALTLYSPFTGFVLEKNAFKGMNVMPGTALFKLADLATVWLYADIYEYELPLVQPGQGASIHLSYVPDEIFVGKVVYVYPSLDPGTRTAKVRFEIPNPRNLLKPEMYANVEIKIELGTRAVVPEGAVIDTGVRQIVLMDKGGGYFEPREVKLGVKVDDYYEVKQGLRPGERVVTSANFLVDSESNLKEAVRGMEKAGHSHGK